MSLDETYEALANGPLEAFRVGLIHGRMTSDEKDAVKIEQDLMEVFPRKDWIYLGHALIWHGRKVCSARKPACDRCTLAGDCPSARKHD